MAVLYMMTVLAIFWSFLCPYITGVHIITEPRQAEISPSADHPSVIAKKIQVQLKDFGIELPDTYPTYTSNLTLKTVQPLVQAASGQVRPPRVSSLSSGLQTTNSGTKVVLLNPEANSIRHTASLEENRNSIIHTPRSGRHAHAGLRRGKYYCTHILLPGEHGNNSSEPVIHRVTNAGPTQKHSDSTRHQQTHVYLQGQRRNLSPNAVVHGVGGSARGNFNQRGRHPIHVELPRLNGNESPLPVIHRQGNSRSQHVDNSRFSYDTRRMRHGHVQSSSGQALRTPVSTGAIRPVHYFNIPSQTTINTGITRQYQASVAARQPLLRTPPTFVEGGMPMPSEYLSIPPSPDVFTPSVPGGMTPADITTGLSFESGGGPIAPYNMPFRSFGPLAHLPPFLRQRMRRRMRRPRRLHFMRRFGSFGPYGPFAGPVPVLPRVA